MCGIAGIIVRNRIEDMQRRLRLMLDVQAHRGPDDEGVYLSPDARVGLGHKRLSIIDLSSAGRQPMSNRNETLWVTYNGEIYNYIELRRELEAQGHRFVSASDTEVILHAYEEWGKGCVDRFNGMFAFALWDARQGTVFLVRDRIGIKPLYYYHDKRLFAFASEIKALLMLDEIERKPDLESISDYLSYLHPTGDKTFYRGIKLLRPGHEAVLDGESLAIRKYWDIDLAPREHLWDEGQILDELDELLNDSVKLRMRSDVPVGAHLSGGLDSSLLVGIAASQKQAAGEERLNTFSGFYNLAKEYDETPYSDMVAERWNTIHHKMSPKADEFLGMIPRMLWHLDQPAMDSTVLSQYFVCRLASSKVKVVFGGQGGDELWSGYPRYLLPYLRFIASDSLSMPGKMAAALPALRGFVGFAAALGLGQIRKKLTRYKKIRTLIDPGFTDALGGYRSDKAWRTYSDPLRNMWMTDLKEYLPSLLHLEDRTSMAVSLESRVPLLDHRLIEFSARVSPHAKMSGSVLKRLLRKAGEKYLPREVCYRKDKQGFYTPTREWFRAGKMAEFIRDSLTRPEFVDQVIKPSAIQALINKHLSGGADYSLEIWMILQLELWHKIFIKPLRPAIP